MKVIYYGAGSYLARNMRRLNKLQYEPVCVCDMDSSKWYKPFCGHERLMVLPLSEALERYKDCRLYVTVDSNTMGTVLYYLTAECLISKERIENWAPIEYRLGCNELETTIKFHSKRVFVRCYWRRPGIDRSGDTAADIRRFDNWRAQTIQAIRNGELTPCDGCEYLTLGWHLADRKLTSLQVSESDEYSFCNFNCCYCFTKARNKNLDSSKLPDTDEQLEVLRYVSENIHDSSLELQFSTGEITVHPNRGEIVRLFSNYETILFTNASVYNQQLAALMEQGMLTIVVSMDCGTAETFRRIKAVDCYDKVCDNLVCYAATGGCVILKYIMLPGINDNEIESDGFVDLAKKLGAVIQISNDTRTKCADLPERALRIVCRIASRARKQDLLVIHEKSVFSMTDNKVIGETLKNNAET